MSVHLVSFFIVFTLFLAVVESVRRGILETKYSLLWIFTCIVLGILSLSDNILETMANFIGVEYAPSLLFLFGLLCTLILIFDLTRRISSLNNKVIILTQEFALLEEKYREEIRKFTDQKDARA